MYCTSIWFWPVLGYLDSWPLIHWTLTLSLVIAMLWRVLSCPAVLQPTSSKFWNRRQPSAILPVLCPTSSSCAGGTHLTATFIASSTKSLPPESLLTSTTSLQIIASLCHLYWCSSRYRCALRRYQSCLPSTPAFIVFNEPFTLNCSGQCVAATGVKMLLFPCLSL